MDNMLSMYIINNGKIDIQQNAHDMELLNTLIAALNLFYGFNLPEINSHTINYDFTLLFLQVLSLKDTNIKKAKNIINLIDKITESLSDSSTKDSLNTLIKKTIEDIYISI